MQISIIAAIGKNRELGKDNKLLWHIPEDFKRFKTLTSGHIVIMGRKTFESIGKPLPDRINIVITHDIEKARYRFFRRLHPKGTQVICSKKVSSLFSKEKATFVLPNLIVCSFLENAIELAKKVERDEVFIIGGASIYKQGIKYADKLYLTLVNQEYPEADAFFPDYLEFKKIIFEENHFSGGIKFKFMDLTR